MTISPFLLMARKATERSSLPMCVFIQQYALTSKTLKEFKQLKEQATSGQNNLIQNQPNLTKFD